MPLSHPFELSMQVSNDVARHALQIVLAWRREGLQRVRRAQAILSRAVWRWFHRLRLGGLLPLPCFRCGRRFIAVQQRDQYHYCDVCRLYWEVTFQTAGGFFVEDRRQVRALFVELLDNLEQFSNPQLRADQQATNVH